MYVCMYVYTYVCMHKCTYVYMYICVYVRMYACMYVFTYVCMYVCMYVRRYVSMYVCMCIHTHTHTHTHIYIFIATLYTVAHLVDALSYKPKGAALIPNGPLGCFTGLILPVALSLGSTHPPPEMSSRDGWCEGLTTLPPWCADSLEILGDSKSCSPWACQASKRTDSLALYPSHTFRLHCVINRAQCQQIVYPAVQCG